MLSTIKFHQNGLGNEYGEDHSLTSNWDSCADYGKEYAVVHFRIEAAEYHYPEFHFSTETDNEEAFYAEVKNALEPLGWTMKNGEEKWHCDYIVNGEQQLYLHPQDFSGIVRKNEIGAIAEALKKHNTFYLRWVDLFKTVFDISDSEYTEYLNGKDEDIRKDLFENFSTTRKNNFYYVEKVSANLASKYGLKRIGSAYELSCVDQLAKEHIVSLIGKMIEGGLLMEPVMDANNGRHEHFRGLNKTEKKKVKFD